MENPATWDEATRVIDAALAEAGRQQQEGIIGQSTAGIIHDALEAAGLLFRLAPAAPATDEPPLSLRDRIDRNCARTGDWKGRTPEEVARDHEATDSYVEGAGGESQLEPDPNRELTIEWLQERHDNCIRISNLAGCDDPEEWRSDARYFADAILLIQQAQHWEDRCMTRLREHNEQCAYIEELEAQLKAQPSPQRWIATSPKFCVAYEAGDAQFYSREEVDEWIAQFLNAEKVGGKG